MQDAEVTRHYIREKEKALTRKRALHTLSWTEYDKNHLFLHVEKKANFICVCVYVCASRHPFLTDKPPKVPLPLLLCFSPFYVVVVSLSFFFFLLLLCLFVCLVVVVIVVLFFFFLPWGSAAPVSLLVLSSTTPAAAAPLLPPLQFDLLYKCW